MMIFVYDVDDTLLAKLTDVEGTRWQLIGDHFENLETITIGPALRAGRPYIMKLVSHGRVMSRGELTCDDSIRKGDSLMISPRRCKIMLHEDVNERI